MREEEKWRLREGARGERFSFSACSGYGEQVSSERLRDRETGGEG